MDKDKLQKQLDDIKNKGCGRTYNKKKCDGKTHKCKCCNLNKFDIEEVL